MGPGILPETTVGEHNPPKEEGEGEGEGEGKRELMHPRVSKLVG